MTPDHSALIERLEGKPGDCPFCGRDPYHYVDNGVGMERVAVTCCDEGVAYFQHGDPVLTEQMALRREAADALRGLTEWRDIATAPRDGELILCFYPDRYEQDRLSLRYWAIGDWPSSGRTEGWADQHRQLRGSDPTHWLPLPSAPNQAKEAGE